MDVKFLRSRGPYWLRALGQFLAQPKLPKGERPEAKSYELRPMLSIAKLTLHLFIYFQDRFTASM